MHGASRRRRTSPRQAVVVLADQAAIGAARLVAGLDLSARDALSRCRVLDLLAELVRVDGVTISVGAVGRDSAADLAGAVPAGVEVALVCEHSSAAGQVAWVIRAHLERSFERVVVLSASALPVPSRIVSTGLTVLATADLVVGPTPGGGVFLVGARGSDGAAAIASGDLGAVESIERGARANRLTVRRLESRADLSEAATGEDVRVALPTSDAGAPCLTRWLADFDAAKALSKG